MTKGRKLSRRELDNVFSTPVVGNHVGDAYLWTTLDRIILDDRYDIAIRAKASRMVDAITGCESAPASRTDAERVAEHVAQLRDVRG